MGDRVAVSVDAGVVLRASARVYLVPVGGLLLGAALAQLAAGLFLTAEAAGRAAGVGGIAGALGGVLLARRLGARSGSAGALPTVSRVLRGLDEGGPQQPS